MEVWRKIPGFSTYEVSNLGRVRSYHTFVLMALGEFRELTEHYDDECILLRCKDLSEIMCSVVINQVIILMGSNTDDDSKPIPRIILT